MSFRLGRFDLQRPLLLAPMAGVSDVPFREACIAHGADLAVAEMLSCNVQQWHTRKNRDRLRRSRHAGPEIVQIAGSDPAMMAEAAIANVALGADIIDINMGCPAKKVLQHAAGSALLKDPALVERILRAVRRAVEVPVTLKIRTGWSPGLRNGVDIARLAEDCGVSMLTVHGRTRECRFRGDAEYDTIAAIKQSVQIPVIANGDITTGEKAAFVLRHTGADGLMIGRAAQGQPWLFSHVRHHLDHGQPPAGLDARQRCGVMHRHIARIHDFYDEQKALLFARKHISWYAEHLPDGRALRSAFNALDSLEAQQALLTNYSEGLNDDTARFKEIAA